MGATGRCSSPSSTAKSAAEELLNLSSYIDYQRAPSTIFPQPSGGPEMATPESWIGSSVREQVRREELVGGAGLLRRRRAGGQTYRLSGEFRSGPTRFQFSATPNYLRAITRGSMYDVHGRWPAATTGHATFRAIDQSTFLMQLRANYTLGPTDARVVRRAVAAEREYYGFRRSSPRRAPQSAEYSTDSTSSHSVIRWGRTRDFKDAAFRGTICNRTSIFVVRSNAVLRWSGGQAARCTLWRRSVGYQRRRASSASGILADSFGAQATTSRG